uniref:Transcriptional regulator n=1 Tax=Mesocestoides corti TaxID=53468 RepID=A0A5K3G2X2_MESCO
MVFLGGSILARLMQGGSANCWVTKKEWAEQGERVLARMDAAQ